jgi:hypothetical protein
MPRQSREQFRASRSRCNACSRLFVPHRPNAHHCAECLAKSAVIAAIEAAAARHFVEQLRQERS